jgi:hypothetical protein
MRFFTRRWHGGELSDAESDGVAPAYEKHFATIAAQLPPALHEFTRTLKIHDALMRSCRVDDTHGTLALDLLIGDLGIGYFDLRLFYEGVSLAPSDRAALARVALDPEADALYDELDISPDGTFIHRWLWWPYAEFDITFAGFSYTVTPRPDRSVVRDAQPFVVVRPSAGHSTLG